MDLDFSQYTSDDDEELSYDEEFSEVSYNTPSEPVSNTEIADVTEYMLLCYLAASTDLWIRCMPIIKSSYFSTDYMSVVSFIFDYEKKNQQLPSSLLILGETGIRLEVPEDFDDIVVINDISNRVEEFCRHRAAADFLIESADIISKDKTKSTMGFLVSEMERISQISVHQDFGFEVYSDASDLLEKAESSDGLPTGFYLIDEALNGGVTSPSYNIVSAASSGGKSIFLQNLAVNYSRQGFNVVYISLELPEFMIEKRFAAMITETPINTIYKNMGSVIMQMHKGKRKYGKIQIKRFPMVGTTIAEIRSFVTELEAVNKEVFSHIIIDYPDLMKPMNPNIREDNIHLRDQTISVEIYDWAHDPKGNRVIWGASQQVKGAKDEKDARQSGVAGGTGKVNTCDNLLILKRSSDDIEENLCWVHIEKGRNGGTGRKLPMRWDSATQRMTANKDMENKYSNYKTNKVDNDPLAKAKTSINSRFSKRTNDASNMIRKRASMKGTI